MTGEKGRGPYGAAMAVLVTDDARAAQEGTMRLWFRRVDPTTTPAPEPSRRPSTDEMRLTAAWVKRRRQAERQRRSMNPNVRTAGPRGGNEKPGKET